MPDRDERDREIIIERMLCVMQEFVAESAKQTGTLNEIRDGQKILIDKLDIRMSLVEDKLTSQIKDTDNKFDTQLKSIDIKLSRNNIDNFLKAIWNNKRIIVPTFIFSSIMLGSFWILMFIGYVFFFGKNNALIIKLFDLMTK